MSIDLTQTIVQLQAFGKHRYGDHFRIIAEDYEIVYQLASYFAGDEKGCERYGLDLRKGILLAGPVGCGKTSLMELFSSFTYSVSKYRVKTAREATITFSEHGFAALRSCIYPDGRYKDIFIDDIGVEPMGRYYGESVNVIAEILLSRYDLFRHRGIKTHATTNLNSIELENRYGNRVRSRMKEMFNLIAYEEYSLDKRQKHLLH